jgi:hypothetical protein
LFYFTKFVKLLKLGKYLSYKKVLVLEGYFSNDLALFEGYNNVFLERLHA